MIYPGAALNDYLFAAGLSIKGCAKSCAQSYSDGTVNGLTSRAALFENEAVRPIFS